MYQLSQQSEEEDIDAQKYIKKRKATVKKCNQSFIFGDQLPKKEGTNQSPQHQKTNKMPIPQQMLKSMSISSSINMKASQNANKTSEKQLINSKLIQSLLNSIKFQQNSPKLQKQQIYQKTKPQYTQVQKIQRQQAQLKKQELTAGQKVNKISNKFQVLAQQVKVQRQNNNQWKEELGLKLCEIVESSISQKLASYNRQSAKEQKDIKNLLMNLLQQNIKTEKRLQKMQNKLNDIVEGLNFLRKKPQQ